MPRLTLMCGIPCSGKSTYVRETLVETDPTAVILSTDDFIERYAKEVGKSYVEVFEEAIDPAGLHLDNTLIDAISRQQNIIWDQTNITKSTRIAKLVKFPPDYERHCVCVYTDLRTALLRNSQRHGKFVPRDVIVRMDTQFVPPSDDEGFHHITHLCQGNEL